MRKVANMPNAAAGFVRAMIHDPADGGGVSLFLFRSPDDGPCDADYCHENVAAAERHAAADFGIRLEDWTPIADPRPDCQDDWLAPVRMVRDRRGVPVPGRFERDTG
jgi:hypothetical protein